MSDQKRKQGLVVRFNRDKGIGVIQVGGVESVERYFLHTKFIRSGTALPKPGQTAFFEVSPEPVRGDGYLPLAIKVDIITEVTR